MSGSWKEASVYLKALSQNLLEKLGDTQKNLGENILSQIWIRSGYLQMRIKNFAACKFFRCGNGFEQINVLNRFCTSHHTIEAWRIPQYHELSGLNDLAVFILRTLLHWLRAAGPHKTVSLLITPTE
jgi:hypothetical protein